MFRQPGFGFLIVSCLIFLSIDNACGQQVQDKTVSELRSRFADQIDCTAKTTDPMRFWCGVTRVGLMPFCPPVEPTFFLGISALVPGHLKIQDALEKTAGLVILFLGPREAKLLNLNPDNDEEKNVAAEIIAELQRVLKGEGRSGVIAIQAELFGFLESEAEKQGTPIEISTDSAHYKASLSTRIFLVDDGMAVLRYVVIEEGQAGSFVSIFPILAIRAKAN